MTQSIFWHSSSKTYNQEMQRRALEGSGIANRHRLELAVS